MSAEAAGTRTTAAMCWKAEHPQKRCRGRSSTQSDSLRARTSWSWYEHGLIGNCGMHFIARSENCSKPRPDESITFELDTGAVCDLVILAIRSRDSGKSCLRLGILDLRLS